jgi:hypothetical protein
LQPLPNYGNKLARPRAAIDDSELVTRRDLREFELRLDSKLEVIKGDMALVKWMMGALFAIAVANFPSSFFEQLQPTSYPTLTQVSWRLKPKTPPGNSAGFFNSRLCNMASLTFDTLKFAERLIAAGVPDAHAEAEAAALAEVLEINLKDIVTKDHLDYKLSEVKADLIKWVVGLALAQSGLLVGILLKLA